MLVWKFMADVISQDWPTLTSLLTVSGLILKYLKIERINLVVQTKGKGRFYVGWDHDRENTMLPPVNVQTSISPKAPKSPKRTKAAK